jgi:hypothetical protein
MPPRDYNFATNSPTSPAYPLDHLVRTLRDHLSGRTLTCVEADILIDEINRHAAPREATHPSATPEPVPTSPAPSPSSVFIISYDETARIGDEQRKTAEKLLGPVVWFECRPGFRPPQISQWTRSKE